MTASYIEATGMRPGIWPAEQCRSPHLGAPADAPGCRDRGISLLIGRIDEAIAHARYTVSLDSRLGSTPRNRLYSPRVTELHPLSNRTLTGIRDIVLGHAKGRAADDSRTEVEHLAELTGAFRTAINEIERPVTFEEVRAARERGQELFSAIMALVTLWPSRHTSPPLPPPGDCSQRCRLGDVQRSTSEQPGR